MATQPIYKPTHKFLGQNALSIDYELRKLSQKLQDLETALKDIDALQLGIWSKRD
tara:strand:+ start:282 stop:446 length:165 start_codon:yes stop_codon:yes gene_type:complete